MLFFSPSKAWGVAATEVIEVGTMISFYGGKLEEDVQLSGIDRNFYFAVEFGDLMTEMGFNATRICNVARFVNGVCNTKGIDHRFGEPNLIALNVVSTTCATAKIGFFARRKIYPGEELVIFYGEKYVMPGCKCNSCLRKQAYPPPEEREPEEEHSLEGSHAPV
jgi:SET domain-containing protein